jgi:hypothetical protein
MKRERASIMVAQPVAPAIPALYERIPALPAIVIIRVVKETNVKVTMIRIVE